MICPRCSVAEIAPDTNRCELCGYTLIGARPVAIEAPVADEVFETVQRELADRFELQVLVRRDRGSTLYLARDLQDEQLVSLRLIPRQGPVDGPLLQRFSQAATLAAELRHPHLLPVRKHGVSTSLLWYSMDATRSRTLGAALDGAEPMPLGKALELLEQIASGLEYLHRNAVVHAGVGRESVIVDTEGWVRVADAGTAAAIYRAAGPGHGWEALLDLPFAAPELLERRLMGPAADQYSLGAIAYSCLIGRPPHAGGSVGEIRAERAASTPYLRDARPDLPWHVETAIQRAMRDDPAERFGSVLDFVAVLGGASVRASGAMLRPSGRPSTAQVVVVPPPSGPPPRRWRWRLAGLAVVAAAAAAGAFFALRQAPAPADDGWAEGPVRPPEPAVVDSAATAGVTADSATPVVVEPTPPPVERPRRPRRAAPPATLFVNATPWGSLYVDGELVGNTPQANLLLPAGTHRLRVVRDGFVPWEQEIEVTAGDTVRLTDIVLEPIRP